MEQYKGTSDPEDYHEDDNIIDISHILSEPELDPLLAAYEELIKIHGNRIPRQAFLDWLEDRLI